MLLFLLKRQQLMYFIFSFKLCLGAQKFLCLFNTFEVGDQPLVFRL